MFYKLIKQQFSSFTPLEFVSCLYFPNTLETGEFRAREGFLPGSDNKESACNVGDLDLITGLGRSPGEGHGNPLQYSCLENPHGQRSLGGLQSMGSQRVRHDRATNHAQRKSRGKGFYQEGKWSF